MMFTQRFILTALLFWLLAFTVAAQAVEPAGDGYRSVFFDPYLSDTMSFIVNRLEAVPGTTPGLALRQYHAAGASPQLGDSDFLFLAGHYFADRKDFGTAIAYFDTLKADARLGTSARKMSDLLKYSRVVDFLSNPDNQARPDSLAQLIDLSPDGDYYPLYLFLWADYVSERGSDPTLDNFLETYARDREWIEVDFRRRFSDIILRINALDFDPLYNDPQTAEHALLVGQIDSIKADLGKLLQEAKAINGLYIKDLADAKVEEVNKLLDGLKGQLDLLVAPPRIDLAEIAGADTTYAGYPYYGKYATGTRLLEQLKDASAYYGSLIAKLDAQIDSLYQLFITNDKSVSGKDYSDLELIRLVNLQRNIRLYSKVIGGVDELLADPSYAELQGRIRPVSEAYAEKLGELENRKQRYLAMRKHANKKEEKAFNDWWQQYHELNLDKAHTDELIPQIEKVITAEIQEQYPKDMAELVSNQRYLANYAAADTLQITKLLDDYVASLDYVKLQMDYRRVSYLERERKARADSLMVTDSEPAGQAPDAEELAILGEKSALLGRYQDFVEAHPRFQAFQQPGGGYLVNNSTLYYNMAELQFAITDKESFLLARDYYQMALEADPDFYGADYALFNIGYIGSEFQRRSLAEGREAYGPVRDDTVYPEHLQTKIEDFQPSIDAYRELTTNEKYRDSELFDESLYRLSTLYYEIGIDTDEPGKYYDQALSGFERLVEDPGVNNYYRYQSLSRKGLVNRAKNNDESLKTALLDFTSLLKAIESNQVEDPVSAENLKSSSIENTAHVLALLDFDDTTESSGIQEFHSSLADYHDDKAKRLIMEKTAERLMSNPNAYQKAAKYWELRLATFPLELNNPTVADSIIIIRLRTGKRETPGTTPAAIQFNDYPDMITGFNNKSPWYDANIRGKAVSDSMQAQLDVIKKAYDIVQVNKQDKLTESASFEAESAYYAHMKEYGEYRELFGKGYEEWLAKNEKNDYAIRIIVADKRDRPDEYLRAIRQLQAYNLKYPEHEEFLNHEEQIYTYSKKIYTRLDTLSVLTDQDPDSGLPSNPQELYEFYRDAALRLYGQYQQPRFATDKSLHNSAVVMIELIKAETARNLLAEAKARSLQLLQFEDKLDTPDKHDIHLLLAEIAVKEENYDEAEQRYRQTLAFATGDADKLNNEIRKQIKNNIDKNDREGNYDRAATLYLRLAEELKDDPVEYVEQRDNAAMIYLKGGMYQQAIDQKLQLAGLSSNVDDVYRYYREGWSIAEADTLMADKARGKALRQDFMRLHPSSNYTFKLKQDEIQQIKNTPENRDQAADMYIALYDLMKAKKIDGGKVKPEDIYYLACDLYKTSANVKRKIEVLTYFTETYPKHAQTLNLLETLAREHYNQGDQVSYEVAARKVFKGDSARSKMYQGIAEGKLKVLADQFNQAVATPEKDWELILQVMDDYEKVQKQYNRDGLSLSDPQADSTFAKARAEYQELQAKTAYLKEFDRVLRNTEQADFLRKTPAQLIQITTLTTYENHLIKGERRISKFRSRVAMEYDELERLLNNERAKYLETAQILRAYKAIARINEHASNVVFTQIERFLAVSNEMKYDRERTYAAQSVRAYHREMLAQINNEINFYYSSGIVFYRLIYENYALAGYTDSTTEFAFAKLTDAKLVPSLQLQAYPIDDSWQVKIEPLVTGEVASTQSSAASGQSPYPGQGSVTVPAKGKLVLERRLDNDLVPELLFVRALDPALTTVYYNNSSRKFLATAPYDTLTVNGREVLLRSLRVDLQGLKNSSQTVRIELANPDSVSIDLPVGLLVYHDRQKLLDSMPTEIISIPSGPAWQTVVKNVQTGVVEIKPALVMPQFETPIQAGRARLDPKAQTIWCEESEDQPQDEVAFEVKFMVDANLRAAFVDFLAPTQATLSLNGTLLEGTYDLIVSYEQGESWMPTRVELPSSGLVAGENTLRINVTNETGVRGFKASVQLIEEVRD